MCSMVRVPSWISTCVLWLGSILEQYMCSLVRVPSWSSTCVLWLGSILDQYMCSKVRVPSWSSTCVLRLGFHLFSTFPMSAVGQKKKEVLRHLVDVRSNAI